MNDMTEVTSPTKKAKTPFHEFVKSESFGGFLLLIAASAAFWVANSNWAETYFFLKKEVYFGFSLWDWTLKKPLYYWINDGLMAIFFLLVGLEIKRELLVGELSKPKDAMLAVFAAVGGMIVPAVIYVIFNVNGEGLSGWGIPMATDIAFALGILSLLGSRVPIALKVFLTAVAIVDDLGAVLVIALFYTASIELNFLFSSLGVLALLGVYGYFGGRKIWLYLILGAVAWLLMLQSGVHATIAGVLLAFTIPLSRNTKQEWSEESLLKVLQSEEFSGSEVQLESLQTKMKKSQSPLYILEHDLHPWIVYFIMPLFAFTNAGVTLSEDSTVWNPVTLGCIVGLLAGKPLGLVLFSLAAVRFGFASLPSNVNWFHITGVGFLAGIGFTMCFFIAGLAFDSDALLDQSKIGILLASIVAAVIGLILLSVVPGEKMEKTVPEQS